MCAEGADLNAINSVSMIHYSNQVRRGNRNPDWMGWWQGGCGPHGPAFNVRFWVHPLTITRGTQRPPCGVSRVMVKLTNCQQEGDTPYQTAAKKNNTKIVGILAACGDFQSETQSEHIPATLWSASSSGDVHLASELLVKSTVNQKDKIVCMYYVTELTC